MNWNRHARKHVDSVLRYYKSDRAGEWRHVHQFLLIYRKKVLALSTFLLYRSVWAISFSYLALLERLFLDSCVLLDRLGLDGGHRVAGPVRGGWVGGGGGVGSPGFAASQMAGHVPRGEGSSMPIGRGLICQRTLRPFLFIVCHALNMRATPLHVNCGDPGRESDNLLLPARLKISAKCKIFAAGCFTAAFEVPLYCNHFAISFSRSMARSMLWLTADWEIFSLLEISHSL